MRGMRRMWGVVVIAMVAGAGSSREVSAQETRSLQSVHVGDLQGMKSKFVGLARAFPESAYDWRPMEGVRSVKEVLALMVAECYVFPPMWGAEAAPGVSGGFAEHMERAGALSRDDLIAELERSFDYAIASVQGMDAASMDDEIQFFRNRVHRGTAIMMGTGDAHEHLGQLIAYARMNKIVPPWSQGGGQ